MVTISGPICPIACSEEVEDFRLPVPGVMVHLSPPFDPPILKGIKVHPDNPFRFDFILDKGDVQLSNNQLKNESSKLIKYFLASITVPEQDLWVNLSPYEKKRIIPQFFGLTEMGRDLLAEDYMLKQITASLIYPEEEIGKKFWKRVYEEAAEKFGSTSIPINTFNKVWIVPEKAVVYENAQAGTAYVVESKLKVMLEEDYLSLSRHQGKVTGTSNNAHTIGSHFIREIIIPELAKEVNSGKNFSKLRQVYNSLILATWYKKKIKDSILEQAYADKNKVSGVNVTDPQEKEKIYQRYLKAFKKGVYNYIKEEQDPITKEVIPRKYFSGGVALGLALASPAMRTNFLDQEAKLQIVHILPDAPQRLRTPLFIIQERTDSAQLTETIEKVRQAYRNVVPRSVFKDWVIIRNDDIKKMQGNSVPDSLEVYSDYLNSLGGDQNKLLDKVKRETGNANIQLTDLTKRIKVGYFNSGGHKHVYLLELETRRGPPLEMAIVLKREQAKGDIATNEMSGMRRLRDRGVKRGKAFPVPVIGEEITMPDGRVLYSEQFIKGPTAEELYRKGKLTPQIRKKIIDNLFDIANGLSNDIGVPIDLHRLNWVIDRNGNPIMVDIGKRRANVRSSGKVTLKNGDVVDFRRAKTFLLMSLMYQFGYQDSRDMFIFNSITHSLGREIASQFFQDVVSFFCRYQ